VTDPQISRFDHRAGGSFGIPPRRRRVPRTRPSREARQIRVRAGSGNRAPPRAAGATPPTATRAAAPEAACRLAQTMSPGLRDRASRRLRTWSCVTASLPSANRPQRGQELIAPVLHRQIYARSTWVQAPRGYPGGEWKAPAMRDSRGTASRIRKPDQLSGPASASRFDSTHLRSWR